MLSHSVSNKTSRRIITSQVIQFLVLAFVFASPLLNCVLYIFKKEATSGQLAIVYIIIAIGAFAMLIIKSSSLIFKRALYVYLSIILGGLLFVLTQSIYGTNAMFLSEFKAYCAVMLNIILLSMLVAKYGIKEIDSRIIFWFEIVLTIVVSLAIFKADGLTSGGLINDSSGLLYQNTSYFAAYALGMNLYIVGEKKYSDINKEIVPPIIGTLISAYQLLLCLLAGGRGGVALAIALITYHIVTQKGVKAVVYFASFLMLSYFLIPLLIDYISNNLNINVTGLERIVDLFSDGINDLNRQNLRASALTSFFDSPIWGHGIGSVFYFLGTYSHNCFTDILVETGCVGILLFMIIIFRGLYYSFKLFLKGSLYRFLLFVFICGFTMCLFSGYIWVNQQIWLPISIFIISPNKQY